MPKAADVFSEFPCPACACIKPPEDFSCQCGQPLSYSLVYAPWWKRLVAFLIDTVIFEVVGALAFGIFLCIAAPAELFKRDWASSAIGLVSLLVLFKVHKNFLRPTRSLVTYSFKFVPLVAFTLGAWLLMWRWPIAVYIKNESLANMMVALMILPIYGIYFGLWESSLIQGSPGKQLLKLVVTDLPGHRIGFGHAFLRRLFTPAGVLLLVGCCLFLLGESGRVELDSNIATIASIMALVGLAGPLLMFVMPRRQALHDFIALTIVLQKTARAPFIQHEYDAFSQSNLESGNQ